MVCVKVDSALARLFNQLWAENLVGPPVVVKHDVPGGPRLCVERRRPAAGIVVAPNDQRRALVATSAVVHLSSSHLSPMVQAIETLVNFTSSRASANAWP